MQKLKLQNSKNFAIVNKEIAKRLRKYQSRSIYRIADNGHVIMLKDSYSEYLVNYVVEHYIGYGVSEILDNTSFIDGNKLNLTRENIIVTKKMNIENSDAKTIVNVEIAARIEFNENILTLDSNGYVNIKLDDKTVKLHRFVYKFYNPEFNIDDINIQLDHKDRNTLNNTIDNLRIATNQQNSLNKEKYSNNTSGIKCISFSNSKKWSFKIALTNRIYNKYYYNSKEEAHFALKYLIDNVATEEEKEFIYIDNIETNLTEEQKNNIMNGINEYIEKTKKILVKEIIIKKTTTFIHKHKSKYQIKITIFNKAYTFGIYNTIEEAKPYRDFLVEMFNNINAENCNEYEEKIKSKFNSIIIQQKIYKIINKKIDNN